MNSARFLILVAAATCCFAAPLGVDGAYGSEWDGTTPTHVGYSPNAPSSNFQAPTNQSNAVAYDIYLRADNHYVYGLLVTLPGLSGQAVGNFTNLYFDTNPSVGDGSDLGFEITNSRAFIPGVPGYSGPISGLTWVTGISPLATEFALPTSFFTADPLGMLFPTATEGKIVLRMSQSFGYSAAGGGTYGDNRLGSVPLAAGAPVPEPATYLLMGLGFVGMLGYRKLRS